MLDVRRVDLVAQHLDEAGLGKEIERLEKMSGKKMKPELLGWINQRANILRKMLDAKKTSGEL